MMGVIQDVVDSLKLVIPDVVRQVNDVLGFQCRIYYPNVKESIYGVANQISYKYNDEPDEIINLAVVGIYEWNSNVKFGVDTDQVISDGITAYIPGDTTMPLYSMIRFEFNNKTISLRVEAIDDDPSRGPGVRKLTLMSLM